MVKHLTIDPGHNKNGAILTVFKYGRPSDKKLLKIQ